MNLADVPSHAHGMLGISGWDIGSLWPSKASLAQKQGRTVTQGQGPAQGAWLATFTQPLQILLAPDLWSFCRYTQWKGNPLVYNPRVENELLFLVGLLTAEGMAGTVNRHSEKLRILEIRIPRPQADSYS